MLNRLAARSSSSAPMDTRPEDRGAWTLSPATVRPGFLAVFLQLVLGTAFVAGIVHIVSVLSMPLAAPEDAYTRVAALAPLGTAQLLPKPTPGHTVFPFSDPAMAVAVCRFDLGTAPMRIRIKTAIDGFLSMSFHDRRGTVFYAITDKAAIHGTLEAVLFTPSQLEVAESNDAEDEQPRDLRVTAPDLTGFVMFRALAVRPSAYAEVEEQLKSAACQADRTAMNSSSPALAAP
jgi:uncharacterized membrane protein